MCVCVREREARENFGAFELWSLGERERERERERREGEREMRVLALQKEEEESRRHERREERKPWVFFKDYNNPYIATQGFRENLRKLR